MKTEDRHYGSLYRKYRPKSFEEILAQDHVVEALKRQVETDNLAHAYLFSGSRGTGKTSTALVFAKAINCLNPNHGEPCLQCENCLNPNIDIIEMDAASHNSVDDIRELREFVKFAPARGKKKVYIVDEVHMLSNAAFNALLKTLEEPPLHVIFILATTELHMIPATVQSRCQRYDFKRVSKEGMRRRILDISEGYQVKIEPSAIDLIIRMADGSMRDTLALLEQCLSLNQSVLTEDSVASFFGSARLSDIVDIIFSALSKQPLKLIETLESLFNIGVDVIDLLSAILEVLRDLLIYRTATDHLKNQSLSTDLRIREIIKTTDYTTILQLFDQLTDISKFIRYSKNKESILEITLLKFSVEAKDTSLIKETLEEEPQHNLSEEKEIEQIVTEAEEPQPISNRSAEEPQPNLTRLNDDTEVKSIDSPTDQPRQTEADTDDSIKIKHNRIHKNEVEQKSRTREELDQIWSEILNLISDAKKPMLKNSQIGIFVGDEMVIHIKGLSKAREMLVEMKLKADVIHAAREVTKMDCNVKFVGVEKDREVMDQDAKNVEDYFKNKGISVQIK